MKGLVGGLWIFLRMNLGGLVWMAVLRIGLWLGRLEGRLLSSKWSCFVGLRGMGLNE